METNIIDSPYKDRNCYNCGRCKMDQKFHLYRCYEHNCFVGSGRWCPDWVMEYRIYKFEK